MIEIRHFRLVDTVSKVGSLKKAAEKLFLTQSALSHQLKELETQLDVQIFHRVNNQLLFTSAAVKAVQAQVTLQKQNGGNANIGRQLYPMLANAGFVNINVNPRQVYVDDSKPDLKDGFIRNTFTAMIKGVTEEAIYKSIITRDDMESGLTDLYHTASGGGSFCYTFFKATAYKTE